jgi:WhiB family redox-sensing transcriptional regulator
MHTMPRVRPVSLPNPTMPNWGWQVDAACAGMDVELFFGRDGEPGVEREAREFRAEAICATCPVRDACLEHALTVPERYGVWGGMSEEQRAAYRRRRRRAA